MSIELDHIGLSVADYEAAKATPDQIPVTYSFNDAPDAGWTDTLVLKQVDSHWKLDDVLYQDGGKLTGVLTMHPRGFGFVSGGKDGDVFVPPDAVFEALHGDTVKVEIVGRSPKGAEGRIAGVVQRRNPRVSGILRRKGKSAWVEPDDSRLRGPLVVPKNESDARDGDSQGAAQGGAIQGDSSHGESPRGAIQGDASPDRDASLGGDEHTEEQLSADTEVDRDTLRTLDPDDTPA